MQKKENERHAQVDPEIEKNNKKMKDMRKPTKQSGNTKEKM